MMIGLALAVFVFRSGSTGTVLERIVGEFGEKGFKIAHEHSVGRETPFSLSLLLERREEGITIEGNSLAPAPKETAAREFMNGGAVPAKESTLSGMPLGEHSFCAAGSADGSDQFALCDRYIVHVMVRFGASSNVLDHEKRRMEMNSLCEGACRRVLGEAMGRDLLPDGSPATAAHPGGLEVDKHGMIKLTDWAASHQVKTSYDAKAETTRFAYRGHRVVLPLASPAAIVDGRRVDLGGKFTMCKGATWFVPGAELSRVLKG